MRIGQGKQACEQGSGSEATVQNCKLRTCLLNPLCPHLAEQCMGRWIRISNEPLVSILQTRSVRTSVSKAISPLAGQMCQAPIWHQKDSIRSQDCNWAGMIRNFPLHVDYVGCYMFLSRFTALHTCHIIYHIQCLRGRCQIARFGIALSGSERNEPLVFMLQICSFHPRNQAWSMGQNCGEEDLNQVHVPLVQESMV